ncbi:MAG: UvrD-helicase domain-containing protein, partial [Clostridia bacterium]|nr:UvrD-helicase domain-containing protein [Clostridia bacterium]
MTEDKNYTMNNEHKALDEARLDILRKDGKLMLTEQQKQAVLTKWRVVVSAAAGSGKTSTLGTVAYTHVGAHET